jgi:creatinine amidohydrolase
MVTTWLADADPETSWAHHAWTEFAAMPGKEYAVVVLPMHGFANHGAGQPLDVEETRGSALLRRAVEQVKARFAVRVLPPLRFVTTVGPDGFFGVDPETAHDLVAEVAADVKSAGFHKLVFFNTSPGLEPFVATAALDARTGPGLRAYVIQARALGFDPSRDQAAAAASQADHLAGLLTEIRGHLAPAPVTPAIEPPVPPPARSLAFPAYRDRYLPAISADQLVSLPAKDRLLAIVPAGAIEQHGPHLPVGVDAILGQAILAAALARLPPELPVVVAPPITYGKSTEHHGFPGTLSLSTKTLRRLGLAIAGQLRDLGLRRLAFFNTHGGNSTVLASILHEMQETLGIEATLLRHGYAPDVRAQEAAWGFHANEWETSLMLACAPELVRMDKAVREYPARFDDPGELRPENAVATFAWMTLDISRHGVMGDPTSATYAKGSRWLSAAAEALASKIYALHDGYAKGAGKADLTVI